MPLKDPEARKAYLREYAKRNPAYERVKAWRQENPEKRAEQSKRYAEAHPEKLLEHHQKWRVGNIDAVREKDRIYKAKFRRENPEVIAKRKSAYAKANPAKINALIAKRKAAKARRTPSWLTDDDLWMIEQAYELAALRTKMFGFAWHVDHIFPLQGKVVSGLHVPYNLQVIPWVENLRKGNRVEVFNG